MCGKSDESYSEKVKNTEMLALQATPVGKSDLFLCFLETGGKHFFTVLFSSIFVQSNLEPSARDCNIVLNSVLLQLRSSTVKAKC